MPGGKSGNTWYDEEDLDYDEDEDDYYDQYNEGYEPTAKAQSTSSADRKAPAVKAPTTSKPSALARALYPPGRAQQNVRADQSAYPQVPGQASANSIHRYDFNGPSPDDAVLAARRGAPKLQPVASVAAVRDGSDTSQAVSSTSSDMQRLHISEPQPTASTSTPEETSFQPQPLSEYRMEPQLAQACAQASGDERAALHLVVLGHVDAGKSTLMGRLLHELGAVDAREVHKRQREATQAGKGSFSWAWLLDERPEERARGVTIDVATARFSTPGQEVILLDAPGHRDFVPNMIAGAAKADAALLVVDGSLGGFESGFGGGSGTGAGQTREHAQLARCLGIEHMAVVITKLDTCNFSQDRFQEIKAILQPFLQQCGFRDSCLQWLPAVGLTGENLTQAPRDPSLAAWWSGPSLTAAIDQFPAAHRAVDRPLRMVVAEVGKGSRGSVVVGGKLEAGAVKEGTQVLVLPSGQSASVRGIEGDGATVHVARAGDSVDLTLTGLPDLAAVGPGSVVCHPQWPVPVAAKLTARVAVLDVPIPILTGQSVTIHVHALREAGQISRLVSTLNAKTGETMKLRPRALLKGQTAIVEVSPARPVCVELFSDFRALGRLVLRESGRTLAVGIITALSCDIS